MGAFGAGSLPMKLVLISPEADDARELLLVPEFFEAGLERYHVRKPSWTLAALENWLKAIPAKWRSKLVLHQHHELAEKHALAGRHWPDGENAPDSPRLRTDFTSRSCHDLPILRSALGCYSSVFFSPLFPSISKPGHGPAKGSSETLFAELKKILSRREPEERRTAVVALGGITPDKISVCRKLGFDGVAVLGYIWQSTDPRRAFEELQSTLLCHAA